MGLVLSIYALSILGLVTLSALMTSLMTAVWILGIFHGLCALGIIMLWWIEDRQWSWEVREEEVASTVPARSQVPFVRAVPRSLRRAAE